MCCYVLYLSETIIISYIHGLDRQNDKITKSKREKTSTQIHTAPPGVEQIRQ